MYRVPFALQLVLKVIIARSVGEPHVRVLAADPLDCAQGELGLLDASAVDPALVAVPEHLAPADVAARDHGDG